LQNSNMDKSLFFITLSFVCVWLVVDVAIGKNYLGGFLATIFPFMKNESEDLTMDEKEFEEATNNAPESSAIGSGKKEVKEKPESGRQSSVYGGGSIGYGVHD